VIFRLFTFAALLFPAHYDRAVLTTTSAHTVALSEPSLFGNTLEGRYRTAKLLVVMVAFEGAGIEFVIGDSGAAFGPMQIHPDVWLPSHNAQGDTLNGPLVGFQYPDLFTMKSAMRGGLRILHSLRVRVANGDPSFRNVRSYLYAYASGHYEGTPAARKTIDARCKWIGCE